MTVDDTPMTYNPTVVRFAEKKRRNSDDARVSLQGVAPEDALRALLKTTPATSQPEADS